MPWVTEIIEKKKIEKAKEMLSTQIVDFFNDEFVKKYESEMWFSKCFNMICRDKYLAQIFCHFFELNRPISIESLCSSFVEKLLKEYPEYVPIQKQIFDAIKWLTSDIIRILRKCDDIPKEYVMHFDMYDLGQQSNDIQLETLRGVRQILEKFESNSSKNSSPNSIYTLYGIIQKNISYSEKQYEILEWVSKEKNVKEAMVCLAFLERNEGSVERAIELFEYVADNYPEEVDLYNNVGCLYLDNSEKETILIAYFLMALLLKYILTTKLLKCTNQYIITEE